MCVLPSNFSLMSHMKHDFVFDKPLEELILRPSTISAKFLERGIVALRGQKCDRGDLFELLTRIGDITGFTPSPDRQRLDPVSNGNWGYHQVHDIQIGYMINDGVNDANREVIQWHVEGVSMENTQSAAMWHMYNFTAEPGTGNTGFVDMEVLAQKLPADYRNLLERATIVHMPNWQNNPASMDGFRAAFEAKVDACSPMIYTKDGDRNVASFPRKPLDISPKTGIETLRACPCKAPWGLQDYLHSVDGRKPSGEEKDLFERFADWLEHEIVENAENQIWWEWQEGDVLIPDLYRMAHGVKAGFQPGQRSFYGNWCFPFGTEAEPEHRIPDSEYEAYLESVGL